MNTKIKLGTAKIVPLVLSLAIPAMIGQFVNVVYSIVDRMYIGNIAHYGELKLAAVGICSPILTLITSFAALVGIGGAPLLSMKLGEKDEKGAQQILNNAFFLLSIVSVLITAIVLIFKKPLLMLFGASDILLPYANTYLTIYTAGAVFAIMSAGLSYFIICQGFSKTAMIIVLAGTISNIILDPLFIFVFHLDIAGGALATVLSQFLSCILSLIFLFSKRPIIRIHFGEYSAKVIKRILVFGICPFIILATDSLILIVFNSMLQNYGGDSVVAAATISQSFLLLITMPMLGISTGTQTILSYNYGARQQDRVISSERFILLCCVVFTTFMFVLSRFAAEPFAKIFTDNPDMIQAAAWQIKISVLGIIPLAFQYAFVDGLTALGAVRYSVTASLIRKSTYLVLIVVLPSVFGVNAAFYAEPITDTICAVITSAIFFYAFRKVINMPISD